MKKDEEVFIIDSSLGMLSFGVFLQNRKSATGNGGELFGNESRRNRHQHL
ncbi:MAG: hypothetical protein ACI3ZN_03860 [Candidatus Cryptobacteroides sp.]